MSDGIPFIDIIILLAVAAFLILKLRSVLGKRSGHEKRPEYDPFHPKRDAPGEDKVIHLPNRNKAGEEDAAGGETRTARTETEMPGDGDGIPGLTQIKLADANFDEAQFLGGSRAAFEMIIQAFAAGERRALKPLLADEVYDNFAAAIDEREQRNEKLETTLIGIKEAEIIDASLENKTALVTVKFLSEQINVTRDRAGGVVDGDPSHVARITDLWTFARNVRSRDPNWSLVATESPT
jgi:predicted lipid-binding transport protein (Tim44 family)